MTNGQRRLILIAAIAIAAVQLALGFQAFLDNAEGLNLFSILPAPVASLAVGLIIWMGRDRGGKSDSRRGRIMKGPWS
jgi:hypothetical protein